MHLFFYPIADNYWLVAAIAATLAAIVVLVGPGRSRISFRRRLTLALIRCAVILLLALAMLRPTLVYIETHKEKATLVLLVDQSRSMQVRDALNNKSRWDSLRATLEDCVPALRNVGRDFEVKVYTFDAETHPLEINNGRIVLPATPTGQQTAIGAALEDVLRQENGKRLLGIVVLTDGRQQALPPRDRPAQDVAGQLRHQDYPVFPVVFGESRGLGGVQDVAAVGFPPPAAVFVDTEMTIHGEVKISGYVNKQIPVRLLMGPSKDKMEVIQETKITATEDGQIVPVNFSYTPKTPGEYKLTLEAVRQPGELVTTNNELSSFVQVLKGGLHVLYIEGDLRVEQKFLRRSLDASRDIKVDSILIDARHKKETRPGDFAELLKPGKYDVYILGDLDATAFEPGELEQLKKTIDEGGKGLIMLGGFHSYGPGGYFNTALEDVLPLKMDSTERQLWDDKIREDMHLKGPLQMAPTPRGLGHFVLTLAAGAEANKAAWEKLPPLEGANLFRAADLKPGADVLADAGGNEENPLLVTQGYGKGRVIAFAGDSTWRWWMHGFQSAHRRFWRQIVLWLAHKDQEQQGNVWVRLDNTRFYTGNRVEFTAGAHSPQNEPITDADFTVQIVKPDGKEAPVVMVARDDQMAGSFRDTQQPGDYTIEVSASRKGTFLGTSRAQFTVAEQDLELDNASSDPDAMKGVAKASGGEMVRAEMLPKWLDELMKKSDYLEVKQETKKDLWRKFYSLPPSVFARWPWFFDIVEWLFFSAAGLFFFAVVMLLAVEWYLRKRWGLV
jgi:uncharacterized membrane protein